MATRCATTQDERGGDRSEPGGRGQPGFGVHWLVAGPLLGGASWAVIGAAVAGAFGSWAAAGWLLLGAAAQVAMLALLALSSARLRRARRQAASPPTIPADRP